MFSLPSTSYLLKISNDLEMITYSIPCAVCLAMSSSCRTSNLLSVTWIWRYKVEPSHHWVTIASSGLAMQPINKRIFTWRVFLRRKTKCKIMGRVVIFFSFSCARACVHARFRSTQDWFFLNYQATGSLENDRHGDSILPPRKSGDSGLYMLVLALCLLLKTRAGSQQDD